MHVRHWRRD